MNEENIKIIPITIKEPMKALSMIEIVPEIARVPAVSEPPVASRTIATPRFAPELIPRIDGPAKGLAKTVCRMSPEVASEAPQNKAVNA